MRKFIVFVIIVIFSATLYKLNEYKNINYVKENYIKDKLNVNILTIDKLNLKEIVKKQSIKSKNIKEVVMFEEFGRPDKKNVNTILGAHSGYGKKAKFKDLNKLSLNDEAKFYYKEKEYIYKVIEKFLVHQKDFTILNNVKDKTTLTLLTCNSFNNNYRLIVVLELIDFA